MSTPPIPFMWDGEAMRPLPRFVQRADDAFGIGAVYVLSEVLERSSVSHRHFFAMVREAWRNLPEDRAAQFPNEEALRKHALISVGYCDVQTFVCKFKTEAQRLAATLAQAAGEYAIIAVNDKVVTRYTAKSQDTRAMQGPEFQASKSAVLDYLADMIGVEPRALEHARAA